MFFFLLEAKVRTFQGQSPKLQTLSMRQQASTVLVEVRGEKQTTSLLQPPARSPQQLRLSKVDSRKGNSTKRFTEIPSLKVWLDEGFSVIT